MDKVSLLDAARALVREIDNMGCIPDAFSPDSGHWYGEFSEWEEDRNNNLVIVEWPDLTPIVKQLKEAIEALDHEDSVIERTSVRAPSSLDDLSCSTVFREPRIASMQENEE